MFAMRGIAVSLAFFVLFYCLLSAMVSVSWRGLRWFRVTEHNLANLLFWLRVLPLFASIIVTLVFVVPSFQLLEPRSTGEGLGTMPVALGVAALVFIAWGCRRVVSAQARTSRIVARWLAGSQPLDTNAQTLTFRARRDAPPLTLVGMRKPRVLVSDSTVELLTSEELEVALKHELAHVRSHDNLKKLIFRFCPFPGMTLLEAAWSQAAELAADDAAILNVNDALNLAAALVKLSRLIPINAAPACTVGFVTGSLNERVNRLLAWDQKREQRGMPIARWAALSPLVLVLFCAFVNYRPLLSMTHEATEWLVR
jgi:Zn-dependent protease with chaperone function